RIDDPDDVGVAAGLAALLGQEAMAGIGVAQRLDDGGLGRVVDAGDVDVVALDAGLHALVAREGAHDDVAGAARGFDRGVEVRVHGNLRVWTGPSATAR